MCGIVYARDFEGKKVNKLVRTLYFNQKGRGTEGYGFVNIGETAHNVRTQYEHEIMRELKNNPSNEIMFHHRIPTSTPNRIVSNHPIPSEGNDLYNNKYYLAHNGMIMNCDELKYRHEDMTLRYTTQHDGKFNDSESLLHELALYVEGYKSKIECTGSLAFIMLQTDMNDKPLNLYFGRNSGSPLRVIYEEGKKLILASEGNGQVVEIDKLYRFNYEKNTLTSKEVSFGSSGYTGFTSIDDDMPNEYLPVSDEELLVMPDDRLEELYDQANEYRQNILVEYSNSINSGRKDEEDEELKEELDMELKDADNLIARIERMFPHLNLAWIR